MVRSQRRPFSLNRGFTKGGGGGGSWWNENGREKVNALRLENFWCSANFTPVEKTVNKWRRCKDNRQTEIKQVKKIHKAKKK